ncbi:MAG: PAS domain S-box protein [Dehalococcoidia bacterium]
MTTAIRTPHFWAIASLISLVGVGYYGEQVGFGGKFFSSDYAHDLHRGLLLIPMLYAAAVFRIRGAVFLSIIAFCIVIPRGLIITENLDPLLRPIVVMIIASTAALLLGIERDRSRSLVAEVVERLQAEEALRWSEARYRALFDNTSDSIIVRDIEGNIIMANRALADLTGYGIDELKKMNISHFLNSSSFEMVMQKQGDLLGKGGKDSSERYEITVIRRDGSERIAEARTSLMTDEDQNSFVLATIRDITDEKKARDAMHAYALQVTRAQENERKRIARELHDETIQDLAGIGMAVDSLMNMQAFSSPGSLSRLEELRNNIDGALERLRYLTQDLRPPMLETLGLTEALQWLVDNLRVKSGVEAALEISGENRRFSPDTEVLLYRIVQEALNNVRKHSRADEATVKIDFMPQKTTMSISDNGQGFQLDSKVGDEYPDDSRLGLIGMQERARLLGGTLTMESEVNKGTTVIVEIPRA